MHVCARAPKLPLTSTFKGENIEMARKSRTTDLCVIKRDSDCLSCSLREARWGIKIIDDYGSGGFNFFVCEVCLQRLLNKIKDQKKNT